MEKLLMESRYFPRVELICYENQLSLFLPTAYNIAIILITAILGYSTRKLPENFNESMSIFVCAAATIFLWMSFFPVNHFLKKNIQQLILFIINLVVSVLLYTACLFVPKIYAIIFLTDAQMNVKTLDTMTTTMS